MSVRNFLDYSSCWFLHISISLQPSVGAVLMQVQDGIERPIAFFSKKLNLAQRNYSTTERECLRVLLAIEVFGHI
jgi:RNase H-like domain found in reverse transcriptase